MPENSPPAASPLVCSHCDKVFKNKKSLANHRRRISNSGRYECGECGKAFATAWNLKQHMPVHTKDKPFECEQCGKRFARKGDLKLHMRRHDGTKPFQCPSCPQSFVTSCELGAHWSRVHEDEEKGGVAGSSSPKAAGTASKTKSIKTIRHLLDDLAADVASGASGASAAEALAAPRLQAPALLRTQRAPPMFSTLTSLMGFPQAMVARPVPHAIGGPAVMTSAPGLLGLSAAPASCFAAFDSPPPLPLPPSSSSPSSASVPASSSAAAAAAAGGHAALPTTGPPCCDSGNCRSKAPMGSDLPSHSLDACSCCCADSHSVDDIELWLPTAYEMRRGGSAGCLGCEIEADDVFNPMGDVCGREECRHPGGWHDDHRDCWVRCQPGELHLHHSAPSLDPATSHHHVWRYEHTHVGPDGVAGWGVVNDTAFAGGDLAPVHPRPAASASACCELCAATPECTCWTWVPKSANPKGPLCWVKDTSAGQERDPGRISGHTVLPEPPAPTPPPPQPPPVVLCDEPMRPDWTCKTCRRPDFSWDTLPVFVHVSAENVLAFGADVVATLAKFPVVTIEKWQGCFNQDYSTEEAAMLEAARSVKSAAAAAGKHVSVVVWFDSYRIYSNKTLNPSARNTAGIACMNSAASHYLESSASHLLKNAQGELVLESFASLHVVDYQRPEMRRYMRDHCLNMTRSGLVDGCGIDGSQQRAGTPAIQGVAPANATAWNAGKVCMMNGTTAAIGNGLVVGKMQWELGGPGGYANAIIQEGCDATNATVINLRAVAARSRALGGTPLVYECHTSCDTSTADGCDSNIAAFLAGAGPNAFWGCNGWVVPNQTSIVGRWAPHLFERPLGEPLADAAYDAATQTWTRSFSRGASVSFNAATRKGHVLWGS